MDEDVSYFLPYQQLQTLIDMLSQSGYLFIGPQVRDGNIVYEPLNRIEQLPWGVRDNQLPGQYKLEETGQEKAFLWANGAEAIKPILFKPKETVWKVNRNEDGKLEFLPHQPFEQPVAILGARACDLAAMEIQDKVFLHGQHVDANYSKRRNSLFVIGVNCGYSSNNCFCVSAGTGPEVKNSYDILLTEVENGFIVKVGTDNGAKFINSLDLSISNDIQQCEAKVSIKHAADMQTKKIPHNNSYALREVLFNNLDHPRWQEVADRCLSCGNCTQVCPTCFCYSEVEEPALDGSCSNHNREWDSCFTAGHSYAGGNVIRDDTSKRYRQWLTHKVGSWFDQFDVSGCVGCGRCVSWCPVGIDLTEELAVITGESNLREGEHDE